MDKKYKGVSKDRGKYMPRSTVPKGPNSSNERLYLGSCDTGEEAARAYDAAEFCIHGEGGKFNFIDNIHNIEAAAQLFVSRHNIDGGIQSLTSAQIQEFAWEYAKGTNGAPSAPQQLDVDNLPSSLVKESTNPGNDDQPSNAKEDPIKRSVNVPSDHLLQEIKETNRWLIQAVVDVMKVDYEGTLIKVSFYPIGLTKGNYEKAKASPEKFPYLHLELMVKADYPNSSPVMVETLSPVFSWAEGEEAMWMEAKSKFSLSLRELPQPVSLKEMAKKWELCAHGAYREYAIRQGGGDFTSTYGDWKKFVL